MWEILHNSADWHYSKILISQGILKIQIRVPGRMCTFGCHTFVPTSWMCKKQTSVSQCSKESEVISLDTCLRMDGSPALDLWDFVLVVLQSSSNQVQGNLTRAKQSRKHQQQNNIPNTQDNLDEVNVDYVASNPKHSRSGAMPYIF